MSLNVRSQKFVEAIIAGRSATQAYLDAGYKGNRGVAATEGNKLLRKPEIITEIRRIRREAYERITFSEAEILGRLAEIAEEGGRDRVQALKLIGQAAGMFLTTKLEHSGQLSHTVSLGQYTDDELATLREIQSRAAERGGDQPGASSPATE